MEKELNEKRITELSKKYEDINVDQLQNDYFGYLKYLEDNCELNLRNVLKKYFNDEELNDVDLQAIADYVLLSDPSLYSGQVDGPTSYEQMLKKTRGSGTFTDEEKAVISEINSNKKAMIK